VVSQGLDVLFPFIIFGDFGSLFLGIFLGAISRHFSLGFGGGCMHEPFMVLFRLIPHPNP
jgi:UDP-N-acetylmuramyl pentapeptide phosphotransferase/UDP-N-acetylglucosamine-1-phosphate transferase